MKRPAQHNAHVKDWRYNTAIPSLREESLAGGPFAPPTPKFHIGREDVVVWEREAHKFMVDASELGWPPGNVPRKLTTDLGNKLPLYLFADNGDQFIYRQQFGCIRLYVWND